VTGRARSEADRPVRRRPRRARIVLPVLVSLVAIGVLFVGVFPTRALLAQRRDIAAAQEQLRSVEARNAELEDHVADLGTDGEVERLAREQYGLVYPGEEAYALLPAPAPPIPVPDAWPFRGLAAALQAGEG
jgi:cell division protein FtsB